jgi:hypothetical protein
VPVVVPPDTIDEVSGGTSLGVVDDTCELRIDIDFAPDGRSPLQAHANLFVAPPDFAPDRRPFLTAADELNDRAVDWEERNAALTGRALDEWVSDLFERVYEHVSLTNVDFWKGQRGIRQLPPQDLAATPIPGDNVAPPESAMGSRDALRNRTLRVGPATQDDPLPLSGHARERHRTLSDTDFLKKFVLENPARLETLVRGPFEVEPNETANISSMRMPPFMRNSNALPLTLAAWQYSLLMRWVAEVQASPGPGILAGFAPAAARGAFEEEADRYRDSVLNRLDARDEP